MTSPKHQWLEFSSIACLLSGQLIAESHRDRLAGARENPMNSNSHDEMYAKGDHRYTSKYTNTSKDIPRPVSEFRREQNQWNQPTMRALRSTRGVLSRLGVLPARLLLELHLEDVDEVVHVFLLLLDRILQRLEVRPDVLDFALVVLQRLRARLQSPTTSPQRTLNAGTDCMRGAGGRVPGRT